MTVLTDIASGDVNIEAELGALINNCGKMRMLSHRVLVTLLIENMKDPSSADGLRDLEANLTEFAKIAADVSPGSATSTLPSDVKQVLARVEAVSPSQSEDLTRFVTTARSLQIRLSEPASQTRTKAIEELADFVKTPLLKTLNTIVEGMGRALNHVVLQRQSQVGQQGKTIRSSIAELEKISRMIMIISVNASIEASRVGEVGRGFSAVAGEIRMLSQSANKVISSLRSQYERKDSA